jgi:hypothetical protein
LFTAIGRSLLGVGRSHSTAEVTHLLMDAARPGGALKRGVPPGESGATAKAPPLERVAPAMNAVAGRSTSGGPARKRGRG